jgi:hypothetical protein
MMISTAVHLIRNTLAVVSVLRAFDFQCKPSNGEATYKGSRGMSTLDYIWVDQRAKVVGSDGVLKPRFCPKISHLAVSVSLMVPITRYGKYWTMMIDWAVMKC